tara:strand:+ start:183 stop:1946 length:1764 start_codon:yes stop_codon:yes gene_type:complete
MKKKNPPKAKKKKVKLTPEQKILIRKQRRHTSDFANLFRNLDFTRVKSDKVQIIFEGRSGEIDEIFFYENIILLVEVTVGKGGGDHLFPKKPLFDKIHNNQSAFVQYAKETYPALKSGLRSIYAPDDFQVKIIYASLEEVNSEHMQNCPNIHFIQGGTKKYFLSLAKTIHKSARIEFFNFLEIEWNAIGENAINSQTKSTTYEGHLLPEGNSSYPDGYKIVSFYADPESLISQCYVLRRDGWRDDAGLYQRVLVPKKISNMRRYLVDEKRVFVNNVIVTLPSDTVMNIAGSSGKNIPSTDLKKAKQISISIPAGYNNIGIVDGQHRVFCYHEGIDTLDSKIDELRKRQNLLVTGIVYPDGTSETERRAFEAKLFLEINDNQTRTRSALRQDIEVIVRPFLGIAVAKRVMQGLSKKGPYTGLFQSSYFDAPNKIKTSSIVSYGLRPLVKFDGTDSLYHAWENPDKHRLKEREKKRQKDSKYTNDLKILEAYIEYCIAKINDFFIAAKLGYGPQNWTIEGEEKSALLTPTAVNGLIACLRKVIDQDLSLNLAAHKKHLGKIGSLKFSTYKSSNWQSLGEKIFKDYYTKT